MHEKRSFRLCLTFTLLLSAALIAGEEKKVLRLEDYTRWNHIISPLIASDGDWISYAFRPNGGDPVLFFKSLSSESSHEIQYGSGAKFSEDSQWAGCLIGISGKEAEKLKKEKKPVPQKGMLLNLSTGEQQTIEKISAFEFSRNSTCFAAKRSGQRGDSKHKGADLVLINLENGLSRSIGNVGEYRFNKPGSFLAYTVDASDKHGNGLYVLELDTGRLIPLDTGEAIYAQIAWDKEGGGLAVLKGTQKEDCWERDNILLAFTDLGGKSPKRFEYDPSSDPGFPENRVISERVQPQRRRGVEDKENRALIWSENLSRIFCGLKPQAEKPKKSEEPLPNVDVWHWKDEKIQSLQEKRLEYDLNFTYRTVIHLKEMKLVQLADEKMRTVALAQNGAWGVGRNDIVDLADVETMQADYYAVDTASGKRKPIAKGIRRQLGLSPDSRFFLYLEGKELKVYGYKNDKVTNISAGAPVGFVNEEDDHPGEKPPWGLAGWTKDGEAVIVNHKYDLWLLPLNGRAPTNITRGWGDKEEIRFRIIKLDPEEKSIDTSKPLLLSAYGEWTKKSGFYSLKIGAEPRKLVFADKHFGMPLKSKKADRLLYNMETFTGFPDYYVSGMDFVKPEKVTDANPQQNEYAWGRRILIDYTNSKGRKLQATLTLPADYVPGRKYPMVVYFYEKMSQRHHHYSMPTYDDRPHMSAYASDGYLVLMPDIVFEIGKPGTSSLDCVGSAVKQVVDLGYADPKRIGLQGHSWGGFQAAFIVTQTDMFACVIAGAAPSCIEGEFNQVFKSSGNNNHSYYSRSQGRMGTDPWRDHALYRSQSAIQNADRITTPFLLLHGTEDGSVDWLQSLEYYNAARYLGKEVIFLSYPGEPHHLAKEENQKDFQIKMKQYFDHYLKGLPMPEWMREGVPYIKKKRLFDAQKESKTPPTPQKP